MKKVFENPEISVCLFRTENILTASGVGNYTDTVTENIGASDNGLTTTTFGSLFGSNQ